MKFTYDHTKKDTAEAIGLNQKIYDSYVESATTKLKNGNYNLNQEEFMIFYLENLMNLMDSLAYNSAMLKFLMLGLFKYKDNLDKLLQEETLGRGEVLVYVFAKYLVRDTDRLYPLNSEIMEIIDQDWDIISPKIIAHLKNQKDIKDVV